MKYRHKLFSVKKPFDTTQTEPLFTAAVKENCLFQYEHCQEYKQILDDADFNPCEIKSMNDISELPFIPTLFFKNHNVITMRKSKLHISATSSGTRGKFSNIHFDISGLLCGLKMVLKIGKWRRLFSIIPANYIIMGYKPHRGNKTAVTKTAFGATLFAPAASRTYALNYTENGYKLNMDGIIEVVKKCGKSRLPLRFMGFPSYTFFLLKELDEQRINVKLKKGSKILLGGGWKQFYAEQVDKSVLYALAEKVLGISQDNIIEFFGAVEHPILYCDCKRHHFHVPVYSRVIIRDVKTLKPLPNGEAGLVNLVTPMVKATPILSVMTDDIGILHNSEECGCGINSPYLEIVGRIGLKDIKTCAAGAAEFLSGRKL